MTHRDKIAEMLHWMKQDDGLTFVHYFTMEVRTDHPIPNTIDFISAVMKGGEGLRRDRSDVV